MARRGRQPRSSTCRCTPRGSTRSRSSSRSSSARSSSPADFADLDALAERLVAFRGPLQRDRHTRSTGRFTTANLTADARPDRDPPDPRIRRWPPDTGRKMISDDGTAAIDQEPASPPASTPSPRAHWPQLAGVDGPLPRPASPTSTARLDDGAVVKLCRLRYGGSAQPTGASRSTGPATTTTKTPTCPPAPQWAAAEQALDCACNLYLDAIITAARPNTDELTIMPTSRFAPQCVGPRCGAPARPAAPGRSCGPGHVVMALAGGEV